jgi:Na+/melibiose symporter-like transporter
MNFMNSIGMCLVCDLWPDVTTDWQVTYYCVAASLFNFGWAAVQVSHMALVPELTPDEHERVVLNSGRYFFTIASNVVVFLALWLFTSGFDLKEKQRYSYLTYSTMAVGVLCTIWFLLLTREPAGETDATGVRIQPVGGTKWKGWFREPGFYKVGFVYMGTRVLVNVSQVYLPFYITDVLHMDSVTLSHYLLFLITP